MWQLSWSEAVGHVLAAALMSLAGMPACAQTADRAELEASKAVIQGERAQLEKGLAEREYQCSQQFVVSECIKAARSRYYVQQRQLDKALAELHARERRHDEALRKQERNEAQDEQAARNAATLKPGQSPRVQQGAARTAESKAANEAKQADAKARVVAHEAKLKAAPRPPKPAAAPRSANAAEMAAADAREQARQKDIAARKAAIEQKKAQPKALPLPNNPPVTAPSDVPQTR